MREALPSLVPLQAGPEAEIHALYRQILDGWNQRSGEAVAAPFTQDGDIIGFDGSQHQGRTRIALELQQIFTAHETPAFLGKVRQVRFLSPDAAVLQGVVGMIPAGQSDILPELNALQTLVATRVQGRWQVVLFQNTPAQFHGRPELARQLSDELRELL